MPRLSHAARATLAALTVLLVGALFVIWFATPQGVPAKPAPSSDPMRPIALQPLGVPSAIGGGPREAPSVPSTESAPSATEAREADAPMDCVTDDGAPYAGTNC